MAALTRACRTLLIAALGCGCGTASPRTQVMLLVDAEPAVRALATQLQLTVQGGAPGAAPDAQDVSSLPLTPAETVAWPLGFALVPRGGDVSRSYRVEVVLSNEQGPVAVLRAHSGFVQRRTLALRLRFTASCLSSASLACSTEQTCERGACVSAAVDTRNLTVLEPATPEVRRGSAGEPAPPVVVAGSGGVSSVSVGVGMAAGRPAAAGAPSGGSPAAADCGNGRLDAGERCDIAIASGAAGACPSVCPAAKPCEAVQLQGAMCQAECVTRTITETAPGDACCPPGADANSDADCSAHCGNGVLESGETCDPSASCPTADSCKSMNACLRATLEGDAASCSARCSMQAITQCASGDGCCPAGCSRADDGDCSPSCGDGIVSLGAGELCEPQSATQPCPTTCDDGNACTLDFLTGTPSNCNAACTLVPVLFALDGDGCCPLGANANSDRDCQPVCGNGVREAGEACDGNCPACTDADPCTRDIAGGTRCNPTCMHQAITAISSGDGCCPLGADANSDRDCQPVCGNGRKEQGEICDGNDCPACVDSDPCTREVVVNDPDKCHPTCTHPAVEANPSVKDGCCPNNADANSDADCAPMQ